MSRDELIAILDKHLDQLGEHFTSVQIIATNHESTATGTTHFARGLGDFYARRGATDRWLRDDSAEDQTRTALAVEREEDRDDWQR